VRVEEKLLLRDLKRTDVEWLQSMSTVRRKYGKECRVGVAIVDKVHCEVTAVAVKYQETCCSV
jgi:hypothetical protein